MWWLGAWVAEATGLIDLSGWPPGKRASPGDSSRPAKTAAATC